MPVLAHAESRDADGNEIVLRPAADALCCEISEGVCVLSIRTGHYFTLTGEAATVWQLIRNGQRLDRIDAGAIEELSALGLIAVGSGRAGQSEDRRTWVDAGEANGRPWRTPSVLRCFYELCRFHMLLKVLSLRQVLAIAFNTVRSSTHCEQPDNWSQQLARQIAMAGAMYPFRADCLERSLAFISLAGRCGAVVTLQLGVAEFPFEAHAWVESDGIPLNERAEGIARFKRFPAISAALVGALEC